MNSMLQKLKRSAILIICVSGVCLFMPLTPLALAQPEAELADLEGSMDEVAPPQEGQRKQMKRRMMERMHDGGGPGMERREGRMKRMGNFISFMSTYLASVKDPHQAAGLAALSIKDSYKKQGKPLEAVKVLEDALSSSKDQAMRNVLLFSLRQIYEENNQPAKVLEVSQRILKENVAARNVPGGENNKIE